MTTQAVALFTYTNNYSFFLVCALLFFTFVYTKKKAEKQVIIVARWVTIFGCVFCFFL